MKTCALEELFDVRYGNGLELNALKKSNIGVSFIARTSKNNGVVAKVRKPLITPLFDEGLITVAVSGSVMEAFLQTEKFITAYHIMVLSPKKDMSDEVKLFYCHCLRMNKFKYSYGRQANITLPFIKVPTLEEAEIFVANFSIKDTEQAMIGRLDLSDLHVKSDDVATGEPEMVPLSSLFKPRNGIFSGGVKRLSYKKNENWIPYIRPSYKQSTSIDAYVNKNMFAPDEIYPAGTLYVSTDGQGSHTYSYVSVCDFVPNSNITVLIPKRDMTLREKLFYAMFISHNRFKFSYGRKPKGKRLMDILMPSAMPKEFDGICPDNIIASDI
ncbi:MAG: restriction endonuclease subunit S [Prevotella sp.]|nr:restriction endonuclease subunit S [Prevotella sp.]